MDEKFRILTDAVVEIMQCDISELEMETSFEKDLGADSLDAYQILLRVQDMIGKELPIEQVESVKTLEDAYNLIVMTCEKEETDQEAGGA